MPIPLFSTNYSTRTNTKIRMEEFTTRKAMRFGKLRPSRWASQYWWWQLTVCKQWYWNCDLGTPISYSDYGLYFKCHHWWLGWRCHRDSRMTIRFRHTNFLLFWTLLNNLRRYLWRFCCGWLLVGSKELRCKLYRIIRRRLMPSSRRSKFSKYSRLHSSQSSCASYSQWV